MGLPVFPPFNALSLFLVCIVKSKSFSLRGNDDDDSISSFARLVTLQNPDQSAPTLIFCSWSHDGDALTNKRTIQFLAARANFVVSPKVTWGFIRAPSSFTKRFGVFLIPESGDFLLKSSTSSKIGMEFHNFSVPQTADFLACRRFFSLWVRRRYKFSSLMQDHTPSSLFVFDEGAARVRFPGVKTRFVGSQTWWWWKFSFHRYTESSIETRDSFGYKLIKQGPSVRGTPQVLSYQVALGFLCGSLETWIRHIFFFSFFFHFTFET